MRHRKILVKEDMRNLEPSEVLSFLKSNEVDLRGGDEIHAIPDNVMLALLSLTKHVGPFVKSSRQLAGHLGDIRITGEDSSMPLLEAIAILSSSQQDCIASLSKSCDSLLNSMFPQKSFNVDVPKAWSDRDSFLPASAYWGETVTSMFKDDTTGNDEFYVLGVVLEPTDGSDGHPEKPDTDNDIYSAEEVRKACHYWAEYGKRKGYKHGPKRGGFYMDKDDSRVVVIENFISPVVIPAGTYGEKQKEDIKAGTWLQAYRINDTKIWGEVKSGVLDGLSIGGNALSTPVE